MRKKTGLYLIIGFLLTTCSIISSIFFHFYFWYSFYVIGAFIFFGTLNYKLKNKSAFSYFIEKKWKALLILYFFGVLLGLSTDIIYGRNVARLWFYPHLKGFLNFTVPVFIYYPFGGLQIYEIFYYVKKLCSNLPNKSLFSFSRILKKLFIIISISLVPLCFVLPIINLYFNSNKNSSEIMMIISFLAIFTGDGLVYFLKKESLFLDFFQGNFSVIATMFFSWLISAILTEIPNTFSWEWIYYNVPFSKLEIFKINIIILTIGWFFLVFVSVRWIDFIKIIFKLDKIK